MEIGFGELLVIVVLAVLLLEPKDLPRIAKKSAKMYLGVRSFLKTNWLALAEDAEENRRKPGGRTGQSAGHKPEGIPVRGE